MHRTTIRLALGSSRFDVLPDALRPSTAYTDTTGTSRSGWCDAADLIRFAEAILAHYRPAIIA